MFSCFKCLPLVLVDDYDSVIPNSLVFLFVFVVTMGHIHVCKGPYLLDERLRLSILCFKTAPLLGNQVLPLTPSFSLAIAPTNWMLRHPTSQSFRDVFDV